MVVVLTLCFYVYIKIGKDKSRQIYKAHINLDFNLGRGSTLGNALVAWDESDSLTDQVQAHTHTAESHHQENTIMDLDGDFIWRGCTFLWALATFLRNKGGGQEKRSISVALALFGGSYWLCRVRRPTISRCSHIWSKLEVHTSPYPRGKGVLLPCPFPRFVCPRPRHSTNSMSLIGLGQTYCLVASKRMVKLHSHSLVYRNRRGPASRHSSQDQDSSAPYRSLQETLEWDHALSHSPQ